MVFDVQWKRKQQQSNHHHHHHQFINRRLRSCDDLLSSGHHITRISLMSSEEPKSYAREVSKVNHHSNSDTVEDEDEWKNLDNYFQKNMDDMIAFFRSYYNLVATILFWMFLPIALPLFICKSILYDFIKIRRIFVLTLEGIIMQLEVLVEQMSCIRNSNSPADVKVEKMGRSFHILNMFNPLYWMGLFSYPTDHLGGPARSQCIESGLKNKDSSKTCSPDNSAKTEEEPERSSHISNLKAERTPVKKHSDVTNEKQTPDTGRKDDSIVSEKHHGKDEEKNSAEPENDKEGNLKDGHSETASKPKVEPKNNAGDKVDQSS